MRQQVNLYQPIFRQQRKFFSSHVVGIALLAVTSVLVGINVYGGWQVNVLSRQVDMLRKEQLDNDARIANLSALQGARANTKSIDDMTAKLSSDLVLRSRALQALQAGGTDATVGFAARLEALARGHVEGLWLDHVVLARGGTAMSLSGNTTNAALVPRYLQGLSMQPVLSGARFDEFVIEGPKADGRDKGEKDGSRAPDSPLRFHAGSSTMTAVKSGDKS